MPYRLAWRTRIVTAFQYSRLSVGWAIAFGCTVVSTLTCSSELSLATPVSSATSTPATRYSEIDVPGLCHPAFHDVHRCQKCSRRSIKQEVHKSRLSNRTPRQVCGAERS